MYKVQIYLFSISIIKYFYPYYKNYVLIYVIFYLSVSYCELVLPLWLLVGPFTWCLFFLLLDPSFLSLCLFNFVYCQIYRKHEC